MTRLSRGISQEKWQQCLAELKSDTALFDYAVVKASEDLIYKYLLSTLAHAITLVQNADPLNPDFVPYLNSFFNMGIPNQDTTYYFTNIDGRNSYRIYGTRGTVYFIEFQAGRGYQGVNDQWAQSLNNNTIADFEINDDGSFEILLSAIRPDNYEGNWMRIDPDADWFLVRQVAYGPNQSDGRFAILLEGGDAKRELSSNDQLETIVSLVKGQAKLWIGSHEEMHETGAYNRFISANWDANSIVIDQLYQHGLYDVAEDEALIISVKEPSQCEYWNIQVATLLGQAHDFINRQTCLNGHVDRADSDGFTRFVLSHKDPGVANWVDLCGRQQGYMLLRWLRSDSVPDPQVKKVAFGKVINHLPADTRMVSVQERIKTLKEQAVAIQQRRMW